MLIESCLKYVLGLGKIFLFKERISFEDLESVRIVVAVHCFFFADQRQCIMFVEVYLIIYTKKQRLPICDWAIYMQNMSQLSDGHVEEGGKKGNGRSR